MPGRDSGDSLLGRLSLLTCATGPSGREVQVGTAQKLRLTGCFLHSLVSAWEWGLWKETSVARRGAWTVQFLLVRTRIAGGVAFTIFKALASAGVLSFWARSAAGQCPQRFSFRPKPAVLRPLA